MGRLDMFALNRGFASLTAQSRKHVGKRLTLCVIQILRMNLDCATNTDIKEPPISGSMLERKYAAEGACIWVEFTLDDGNEWVGAFGGGGNERSGCVLFPAGQYALILASWNAYVVRVSDGKLIRSESWDSTQMAVPFEDEELIAIADDLTVRVVAPLIDIWRSERIALDGVRIDSANAAAVSGKVWFSEGWYAFRITRPGWKFEKREFITKDWFAFTDAT